MVFLNMRTFPFWIFLALGLFHAIPPGAAQADKPNEKWFDLASIKKSESLLPWMDYLPDPEGKLTWQTALSSDRWLVASQPRLGYGAIPVWTRLRVENTSSTEHSVVLFNRRPMVNYLDVTVIDHGLPVDEIHLGFMVQAATEEDFITSRSSSFLLELPPGSKRTVLARLRTSGVLELGWEAATMAEFSRRGRLETLALGLNWGIMLALIAISLVSWVVQRQPRFGLLAGYSLFFTLTVVSLNGLSRIVSFGLPPVFWFIGSFFFPIGSVLFWIPFTKFFLKTRTTMPLTNVWLNILEILLTISLCSYLIGPWVPFVFRLSPFWLFCALLVCVTSVWVGVVGVWQRLEYGRMYLVGHAAMFNLAVMLVVAGQVNLIKNLGVILLIYPWSIAAHVIILGISLNKMTRRTREKLEAERQASLEQSRFAAVGRIIGMVVHQWRTPLARLGTELAELNAYFQRSSIPESRLAFIKEALLPCMNENMDNLTHTVDDFSQFFSSSGNKEKFDPLDVLKQVLEMAGGRIHQLNIQVIMPEIDGQFFLTARPSVLAHALLVITVNSLDTFESRRIKKPRLIFDLRKVDNNISLSVSDNGGGINLKPAERVFETFVSDKGKNHMGMGLNIAKRLVEEVLEGTITVENIGSGARFTVTLPTV
jgi:signal transduction histidine kinase